MVEDGKQIPSGSRVSIGEAAAILGVSIATVRRLIKSDSLAAEKNSKGGWELDKSVVEAFKKERGMTISEAASRLGVSTSTLRRYEDQGIIASERGNSGERRYSDEAVEEAKATLSRAAEGSVRGLTESNTTYNNQTFRTPDPIPAVEESNTPTEVILTPAVENQDEKAVKEPTNRLVHTLAALFLVLTLGATGNIFALYKSANTLGTKPEQAIVKNTEGRVLAATFDPEKDFLEINIPTNINAPLRVNDILVQNILRLEGTLEALGATIDLGDGQIFASNIINSFQGQTGDINLAAGDGIQIDGLTITSTATDTPQNTFSNITTGSTTLSADSPIDVLTFAAGDNVTITASAAQDTITIAATDTDTDTTYTAGDDIVLDGTVFRIDETLDSVNTINGLDSIDDTTASTLEGALTLAGDISGPLSATVIGDDVVTEANLKAVNAATDEYCLTYEETVGDFEWESCGAGGGSEFTLAGDTGSSQTISDGDTLSILTDDNLTATASATDTITISIDADAINGTELADSITLDSTNLTFTDGTNTLLTIADAGTTGNLSVTGDLTVSGDDLFLGTNTSGFILVADGTNFNPVDLSGDIDIDSSGATTIQANSVALGTDTTGNYVATIADAGNSTVSISGSGSESAAVTIDVVDVNCSDCLNATEIEDIYVLNTGDTITVADTGNIAALTLQQNDVTNNPNGLTILNTGTGAGAFINQDGNGIALSIDSEATTTDVIDIASPATTTGIVFDVNADALTTGSILDLTSNSSSTGTRNLVNIVNDNTAATGTSPLRIQQDSTLAAIQIETANRGLDINNSGAGNAIRIDQSGNGTSVFILTNATSGDGIHVQADQLTTGDVLGSIELQSLTTGKILNFYTSSTDISSGGFFDFQSEADGTSIAAKTGTFGNLSAIRAESRTSGTTADDFDLLNLSRQNFTAGSGGTLTAAGALLRLENASTQTAGTLTDTVRGIELVMDADGTGEGIYIDHNGNGLALSIDSEATTVDIVDISAAALTTGYAIDVTDLNALTTGGGINVYSNSSQDFSRSLVNIVNDNTGADSTTALNVQQDADGTGILLTLASSATGGTGFQITSNASSNLPFFVSAPGCTGCDTGVIRSDALVGGTGLRVISGSEDITSGYVFEAELTSSGSAIANKSGYVARVISDRTDSRTSGTTADDYDALTLYRSSTTTGSGGTLTAAGSVLRIENSATQTAGTLTDSVIGIELVMDADGTGDSIYIDSNQSDTGNSIDIDHAARSSNVIDVLAENAVYEESIIALSANEEDTGSFYFLELISDADGTPDTELTINQDGDIATDGSITLAGNATVNGNTTIGNANTDTLTINAGSSGSGISFGDSSFDTCTSLETSSGVLTCGSDADTGATLTLQGAYGNDADGSNATIALTTADDSIVINNPSSSGTDSAFAFQIDQDATGVIALSIDAESTTADVIDIASPATTTGIVFDVNADALTTGSILDLTSNSADMSSRTLVNIANQNSSGDNTDVLHVSQAADGYGILVDATGTASTGVRINQTTSDGQALVINSGADNADAVIIEADSLDFNFALTASSGSENISSGGILWAGLTSSGSANTNYEGAIGTFSSSRTDTRTSGTTADDFDNLLVRRTSVQNGSGGTTTVAGALLRLENIATQTAGTLTDTVRGIELVMDADGTGEGIYIDQNANGTALSIDSEATSVGAITVTSQADGTNSATRAGIAVTAESGAGAAYFYSNVGAGMDDVLVEIVQDNTAGDNPALYIQQDGNSGTSPRALQISHAGTAAHAVSVGADSLTTGSGLLIYSASPDITVGNTIAAQHEVDATGLANKTGSLASFTSTRTENRTSGTTADNYDALLISRASTAGGSGGTFTAAGSVLKIENSAGQGVGSTLTDSVIGIELVMDADGTGDSLNIDHNQTSTANAIQIDSETTDAPGIVLTHQGDTSTNTAAGVSITAESGAGGLFVTRNLGAAEDDALVEILADHASGDQPALLIDNDATAGLAFSIVADNTTADVIDISAAALTTGTAIDIGNLNALTTGKGLNIVSNSSSTGTRTLAQITNDNTAATGTTGLSIQQDAAQRGVFIDQNGNARALSIDSEATSSGAIVITSQSDGSNSATNAGIAVTAESGAGAAYFTSAVGAAMDDAVVEILQSNSAGDQPALHIFGQANSAQVLSLRTTNLTSGNAFYAFDDSTELTSGSLLYLDHTVTDSSLSNKTFSLSTTSSYRANQATSGTLADNFDLVSLQRNQLQLGSGGTFTAAGSVLYIENSATQSAGTLTDTVRGIELVMDADGTGEGIYIDHNGNGLALSIDAESTTADVIDIASPATTTGIVFDVNADALTTGSILDLTSNSSSSSTRNLVNIVNDNTAATGTYPLFIQQDSTQDAIYVDKNVSTTTAGTRRGLVVDLDHTGVVTTGSDSTIGAYIDIFRSGQTGGNIFATGVTANVAGSTAGTSTVRGFSSTVSGADTNIGLYLVATGTGAFGRGIEVISDGDDGEAAQFSHTADTTVDEYYVDLASFQDGAAGVFSTYINGGSDEVYAAIAADSGLAIDAHTETNNDVADILASNTSFTNDVLVLQANEEDTGSFNFLHLISDADGTPDTELTINQDGDIATDGSITASGTITGSDFSCTDCLDFAELEDTLDLDAALTLNQGTNTWIQNFTGTTGTGYSYVGNSLTTGGLLSLTSNSSSTGTRNLVNIVNDNTAATGTTALNIQQDANAYGLRVDHNATSTATALGIYSDAATGAVSGSRGAALDIITSVTTGRAIYAASTSLTTGTIFEIYVEEDDISGGGKLIDSELNSYDLGSGLSDYTGPTHRFASIRYDSETSGTTDDDYDTVHIYRETEADGSGLAFTTTGSVLKVENVATQSTGTLTDTVRGIEVVMDADGTGDGIYIDQNGNGVSLNIDHLGSTANAATILASDTGTAFTGDVLALQANRISNTAFDFISATADADGTPDVVFGVGGSGQITSDQSIALNGTTAIGSRSINAAQQGSTSGTYGAYIDLTSPGDDFFFGANISYGGYVVLTTESGTANDGVGYGYSVVDDAGTDGGTAYGLYVDLDDADATNYSIYVESGSGDSYFGSNISSDGQIDAGTSGDGLVTTVNAGACDDTVFTTDTDGLMCIDSSNGRFYFRYGGGWHYAAQTAGFQIPNLVWNGKNETDGLDVGDYVIGKLDQRLSDGALHGVYVSLDNVITESVTSLLSETDAFEETNTKLTSLGGRLDDIEQTVADLKAQQSLAQTGLGALQSPAPTTPSTEPNVTGTSTDPTLDSNLTVAGTLVANENVTVNGELEVHSDVTLYASLIVDTIHVAQALNVHGDSTIFGNLAVQGDTTLEKNVSVGGNLELSAQQGGIATIPRGGTTVEVSFTKVFIDTPLVQLTPARTGNWELPSYWLSKTDNKRFTIELSEPAINDINFSWLAIPITDYVTTTGEGDPEYSPDASPAPESQEETSDNQSEQDSFEEDSVDQPQEPAVTPSPSPLTSPEPIIDPDETASPLPSQDVQNTALQTLTAL